MTTWLLEHGEVTAAAFVPHVARARVVARCPCGCASVDFAVDGQRGPAGEGMEILSDYQWSGAGGGLFGIFVFARRDLLAGLEVWSIDGQAAPTELPDSSELTPLVIQKV